VARPGSGRWAGVTWRVAAEEAWSHDASCSILEEEARAACIAMPSRSTPWPWLPSNEGVPKSETRSDSKAGRARVHHGRPKPK
jgi:hypothetical protein